MDSSRGDCWEYLIGEPEHTRKHLQTKHWQATTGRRCTEVNFLNTKPPGRALVVKGIVLGAISTLTKPADGSIRKKEEATSLETKVGVNQHNWQGDGFFDEVYETCTICKEKNQYKDTGLSFDFLWEEKTLSTICKTKPHVAEWLVRYSSHKILGRTLHMWSKGPHRSLLDLKERTIEKFANTAANTYLIFRDDEGNNGFSWNLRKRKIVEAVCEVLADGMRLIETSKGYIG